MSDQDDKNQVLYRETCTRFSSAKIAVIARAISTRLTLPDGDTSSPSTGRDTIGDMISQLVTIDDQHDKEMMDLRRELTSATKLLADKDKQLTAHHSKVKLLLKKKTEDAQRILDLDLLVKSQGRTLASNRIEIQSLEKRLEPLKDALTARENAHTSQSSLVAQLEKDNLDLQRKYKLLHQKLDVEMEKLRVAQYDKSQMARENANYKKTITTLTSQIEDVSKDSEAAVNELAHKIITADKDLQELRNRVRHDTRPVLGEKFNDENCPPHANLEVQSSIKVEVSSNRRVKTDSVLPEGEVARRISINSITTDLARALAENAVLQAKLQKAQQKINTTNPVVKSLEKKLGDTKTKLEQEQVAAKGLQKQLNKVVAEYKAVAIAHEYANAEAAKLRQEVRAPAAGHKHGIRGGNLLRHRNKHHPHVTAH
eukprot:Plantae.Rhodophyta-Hildenbrandia_rubra.ctg380.p2 GENE.Plantae.Rhodophyta-Hildenbrandia_rubra.ctg380~~Plantae.Rhodophyta-Hildenbrandia_rubra.ctg380.p2  ORF type:complete len:427 (+),score=84.39 Plantae.Rhodophyta-Hildenbrandia_rubra.ctg380:6757-8037(+)